MRSNSAALAVLVVFAASCSAAQSGWEPAPDTKILERPRETETQTILLRLGNRNDSNQSTAILDNPSIQPDVGSDAWVIPTQRKVERCAHIVISEAPEIDPKMVEEIPRTFSSNMPTLQGVRPCCRDFHSGSNPFRTESATPSNRSR